MTDLRTALRLDALASGTLGVLLLALFDPAESELGMPVPLSIGLSVLLLGWAGFVTWVSGHLARSWVTEVIALNVVYVLASLVFVSAGWADLTDLGVALVLVQALAVLGLTVAQAAGLRTLAARTA